MESVITARWERIPAERERNMGVFLFGVGDGHLPRRADAIAKKHGATLVNYIDPGYPCKHRHWFSAPNYGEPFDSATAKAVLEDLIAAGLKRDGNTNHR